LEEIHLVVAVLTLLPMVGGEYSEGPIAAVNYHRHAAAQPPAFGDGTVQAALAPEIGHNHRSVDQQRIAGMRASARLRDQGAYCARFPSGTSPAYQGLAIRLQLAHGGVVNPQGLLYEMGSFVEQLLQGASDQCALAERGYDRLLEGIVVAQDAGAFCAIVDHRRTTGVQ
jgi:hypothetical protein